MKKQDLNPLILDINRKKKFKMFFNKNTVVKIPCFNRAFLSKTEPLSSKHHHAKIYDKLQRKYEWLSEYKLR